MPVRRGIGQRKDAGAQASRAKRAVDVNVPAAPPGSCRSTPSPRTDRKTRPTGMLTFTGHSAVTTIERRKGILKWCHHPPFAPPGNQERAPPNGFTA